MSDFQDTIVALSSAPGEGAIALIRLSGAEAISIVNVLFNGKNLANQAANTAHFGRLMDDGALIDEVVVTLFHGPKSYTGEDVVELACHGSTYIQQKIIELSCRHGARLATPGEFTQRAFINGKMDLAQADAVADLIASQNEATHKVALNQMRGGFSNRLKELRQELIDFAALVELELDFSEEDVEFADRERLRNLIYKIRTEIDSLAQSFKLGNALKNGVQTVIAGRPNAGKSTLLNALLNEERAIVSDIAGTTRDTIEEVLNIEGIPFRLVDTAGIREATDAIEAIGVERTMEKVKQAAILVYVYDAYETNQATVQEDLLKLETNNLDVVVVANKMDLVDRMIDKMSPASHDFSVIPPAEHLKVTAKDESSIQTIKDALLSQVNKSGFNLQSPIVTNARHYEALCQSNEALDRTLEAMEMGYSGELLAFDIKDGLKALGSITGEIEVDRDVLGSVFGRFCIGK